MARCNARASNARKELPEAIVELFYVSEDAHPRMVRAPHGNRPFSTDAPLTLDSLGLLPQVLRADALSLPH